MSVLLTVQHVSVLLFHHGGSHIIYLLTLMPTMITMICNRSMHLYLHQSFT